MARIKFDRNISRVVNDINQGLIIDREIQVLDFPIQNATYASSDPYVLLRALAMVGTGPGDYVTRFPQLYDPYPPANIPGDPDFTFCTVRNQEITGLDNAHRILNARIRYQSPIGPQSPGVVTYMVNRRTVQSFVRESATADGSQQISVWYQPGLEVVDAQQHWNAPTSPNDTNPAFEETPIATVQTGLAQRVLTSRVLEVIGTTTTSNWNAIKATFDAAAGKINSNTTGVWSPRGTWMYMGPDVSTSNGGTIGTLRHLIVEGVGPFRWFPIVRFRDQHGEIPADAATTDLLAIATNSPGYPPPVGNQIRINGLTLASNALETDFATLFPGLEP